MNEDAMELNESQYVSTDEVSDTPAVIEATESPSIKYLEGARLHIVTAA